MYYEDTDAGGVVFYANYLKFMERARTELLRSYGFEQDELIAEQGVIFAVRALQVDYLKPARFNQLLQVSAQPRNIKKVTLDFRQQIQHNNEILVTGEVKIACLDANSFKPKAIPQNLIDKITHEY